MEGTIVTCETAQAKLTQQVMNADPSFTLAQQLIHTDLGLVQGVHHTAQLHTAGTAWISSSNGTALCTA